MKILVTGADGFIGKNLLSHLDERHDIEILKFTKYDDIASLESLLSKVDFVFHLAGVNRPEDPNEFLIGNVQLTLSLCDSIRKLNVSIPIVYSSSVQAEQNNHYGESKLNAEKVLLSFSNETKSPVYIFRLPNVFGKWARPNYNSVVATFCHNICNGLPINIHNPDSKINLVYIDDVIEKFISLLDKQSYHDIYNVVKPIYNITIGKLAKKLMSFKDSRSSLVTEPVGSGLTRALYSTFISYLCPEQFSYEVPVYSDTRGSFVELIKTHNSGQFSFFTANPGVTRGGHYHHTKTEKFLVVQGKACFRFRHIVSDEYYELYTDSTEPKIVETIPGWSHDITNIGDEVMIVLLWANEIFDRSKPDTYACRV